MARYQVRYALTFFKAMDKLDRGTQKVIAKWIDKHLVNVDFPRAPGKYLSGNLSGYVRFRVGSYRIIAKVDEEDFVILNIHVAKRSEVYNFKGED
jgi:plasmid addiction system poison protein